MKLKDYYKKFTPEGNLKFPTVAGFYKDLDIFSRVKVIREGELPNQENGFFPDPQYD